MTFANRSETSTENDHEVRRIINQADISWADTYKDRDGNEQERNYNLSSNEVMAEIPTYEVFFASTFSSKMQIEFLKVAWGISPLLHFLRRHSFGCRRGAVAGIQSLLVTDM